MSLQTTYPLKQVLAVKQRRVEDAEKVVKEKILALEKEKQILIEKEEGLKKAKKHYNDKLTQLRTELDQGTTSPKIQQMKIYLKVTKEAVSVEEKKVTDQKKQVEIAEKNVITAKDILKQKRIEVDKLHNHEIDWNKEMNKELQIIEGREQDELGSMIYIARHR